MPLNRFMSGIVAVCLLGSCLIATAHDKTRAAFRRQLVLAQAEANALAEEVDADAPDSEICQLTIDLVDDFGQSVPGLVRITNQESGKAIKLSGEFHRKLNWYSLAEKSTVRLPRTVVSIEALRGLETELTVKKIDLSAAATQTVKLPLRSFYDTSGRGLKSGNTHLHLMNFTHGEADRYLRVVPRSDNLDLVFLSFLRRIPDERNYISNTIVENSFIGGDLARLSQSGVLFGNGQEHRHNFGRGGEGYGHVMLLNLQKLIRPVSIGPGIMEKGIDGPPLRRGILRARADGATVIWCHNTLGFEDLPSWMSGIVHAQNIFDGGTRGSYKDSFYRYLDLGMKVPFSTGTDWFIYDFARVYVPVDGELTSARWLESLRNGRSYITNGPFLELETERGDIGDTLRPDGPNRITVVGRGMGRRDFGGLELIYNGRVVHRVPAEKEQGYHFAALRHGVEVNEPGWIALRIPLDAGKTELDRPLFAHTSPIYIELAGKRLFRTEVAQGMIEEIKQSMEVIKEKAKLSNDAQREAILDVYRRGIKELERRIEEAETLR